MKRILVAMLAMSATAAFPHPHHGDPTPSGNEMPPPQPPEERPYGRAGDSSRISRTLAVIMDDTGRCSPKRARA